MNGYLVLVLLVTVLGSIQSQAPPQLTLFESPGCTGASTSFNAVYAPNLASQGFDNRARSASIIGTWLFYDNAQYNILGNAGSEYAFESSVTCINFQVLGGYVSSARYPGYQLDYRSSTITFYNGTYFQGAEEYEFEDDASLTLNGSIKSFIITGDFTQSWTLYDRPNFAGNAVCVYPPPSNNFEPALIKDTRDIGIPDNTIASVRKGCQNGARVASYVSARSGVHVV